MRRSVVFILFAMILFGGCNIQEEDSLQIQNLNAQKESFSENVVTEDSSEVIEITEVQEKTTDTDASESETSEEQESEYFEEVIWGTNDWDDDLAYTVTVLDEHMEVSDEIPTSDRIHLQYQHYEEEGKSIFFWAYIEDGEQYYLRGINQGYISYTGNHENMKKMTLINQIRRIKTFNTGSGVDPIPYLITESGEVYFLEDTWPTYDEQMKLIKFDLLEDYQVEDILEFKSEWSYYLKVLLKDGTIIEVQSESWG